MTKFSPVFPQKLRIAFEIISPYNPTHPATALVRIYTELHLEDSSPHLARYRRLSATSFLCAAAAEGLQNFAPGRRMTQYLIFCSQLCITAISMAGT